MQLTSLFAAASVFVTALASTGTNNGYYYSFYNSGDASSVSYTNKAAGEYSVDWTDCDNFVAGKGWSTGSAR